MECNFVDHERISLISHFFTEKQMNRYAKFKESSLENKKKARSTQKIEYPRIKSIVQSVLGENFPISNTIQLVLHGIAKIYAGELVEESKMIMIEEEQNKGCTIKTGPIKPKHLREARRRMIQKNILPSYKPKCIFGRK